MNLIKKLWRLLSGAMYGAVNAVLGIFNIRISEEKWAAFMQFVKFALVGVVNTVIDYCSYLIALHIFAALGWFGDWAYIPSNFIGMTVSIINAFYWNNNYVFKEGEGKKRSKLRAFAKTYLSYSVTGLGLKTLLLYVLITLLGISDKLAPIIIMFIVVPLNFLLNKFWAFGDKGNE